jgi:hypothetical protein
MAQRSSRRTHGRCELAECGAFVASFVDIVVVSCKALMRYTNYIGCRIIPIPFRPNLTYRGLSPSLVKPWRVVMHTLTSPSRTGSASGTKTW